jgi:hypothetical protein
VVNRLLNKGVGTESAPPSQEINMVRKKAKAAKAEPDETRRAWRFSSDCPRGKIFTGDTAIAAAEKDGWKDAPLDAAGDEAGGASK